MPEDHKTEYREIPVLFEPSVDHEGKVLRLGHSEHSMVIPGTITVHEDPQPDGEPKRMEAALRIRTTDDGNDPIEAEARVYERIAGAEGVLRHIYDHPMYALLNSVGIQERIGSLSELHPGALPQLLYWPEPDEPGRTLTDEERIEWASIVRDVVQRLVLTLLGLKDFRRDPGLPSQTVVHGGLRPNNILLCQRHGVVIGDWGASANFAVKGSEQERYLPPETLKKQIYNEYTDIYSIGLIAGALLLRNAALFKHDGFKKRNNWVRKVRNGLKARLAELSKGSLEARLIDTVLLPAASDDVLYRPSLVDLKGLLKKLLRGSKYVNAHLSAVKKIQPDLVEQRASGGAEASAMAIEQLPGWGNRSPPWRLRSTQPPVSVDSVNPGVWFGKRIVIVVGRHSEHEPPPVTKRPKHDISIQSADALNAVLSRLLSCLARCMYLRLWTEAQSDTKHRMVVWLKKQRRLVDFGLWGSTSAAESLPALRKMVGEKKTPIIIALPYMSADQKAWLQGWSAEGVPVLWFNRSHFRPGYPNSALERVGPLTLEHKYFGGLWERANYRRASFQELYATPHVRNDLYARWAIELAAAQLGAGGESAEVKAKTWRAGSLLEPPQRELPNGSSDTERGAFMAHNVLPERSTPHSEGSPRVRVKVVYPATREAPAEDREFVIHPLENSREASEAPWTLVFQYRIGCLAFVAPKKEAVEFQLANGSWDPVPPNGVVVRVGLKLRRRMKTVRTESADQENSLAGDEKPAYCTLDVVSLYGDVRVDVRDVHGSRTESHVFREEGPRVAVLEKTVSTAEGNARLQFQLTRGADGRVALKLGPMEQIGSAAHSTKSATVIVQHGDTPNTIDGYPGIVATVVLLASPSELPQLRYSLGSGETREGHFYLVGADGETYETSIRLTKTPNAAFALMIDRGRCGSRRPCLSVERWRTWNIENKERDQRTHPSMKQIRDRMSKLRPQIAWVLSHLKGSSSEFSAASWQGCRQERDGSLYVDEVVVKYLFGEFRDAFEVVSSDSSES